MKLQWYGHASFRVTANDGTSIITDPYTPEVAGYKPITDPADIVIVSSDNDRFHCRHDLIPGAPEVVNALELAQGSGETTVNGIPIRAIEAMESADMAHRDPDQNGMYRFEVDGVHIGHMGDMGNALSEAQMQFFTGVDILLALAGGHPTIPLDDLKAAIDILQPKLVVPMHFRTLRLKLTSILWLPSFLEYFDDNQVDFAFDSETEITTLPETTRVLVLDYI